MATPVKPGRPIAEVIKSLSEDQADTIRTIFLTFARQVYFANSKDWGLEKVLESIEDLWNEGYLMIEKCDDGLLFKVWNEDLQEFTLPTL